MTGAEWQQVIEQATWAGALLLATLIICITVWLYGRNLPAVL